MKRKHETVLLAENSAAVYIAVPEPAAVRRVYTVYRVGKGRSKAAKLLGREHSLCAARSLVSLHRRYDVVARSVRRAA